MFPCEVNLVVPFSKLKLSQCPTLQYVLRRQSRMFITTTYNCKLVTMSNYKCFSRLWN